MNYNNIVLVFVVALVCGLSSCADQDSFGDQGYKSVDVCLEVSKADFLQTKAGALDGDDVDPSSEVPYCDEELQKGDVVVASYTIRFQDASGSTIGNPINDIWSWSISSEEIDDMSQLSDLKQIDFPSESAIAYFTFNDFRVYDSSAKVEDFSTEAMNGFLVNSGTAELKFITPYANSAYAGYVKKPVGSSIKIDLYEKQYLKMEVLCFEEEQIPLMGFAWTDFEVLEGNEICLFFNCKGTTADTYHQVLPVKVSASFWTGTDWQPYWEGQNYSYADDDVQLPLSIEPFCILCPGNWKVLEQNNGQGGFKIDLSIKDSYASFEIAVTASQIQAFLDGDTDFQRWYVDKVYTAAIDKAKDVPYVHYVFDECFKPQAFYSNIYDDLTTIYSLSWSESPVDDLNVDKVLNENGRWHIALTPDESSLILVKEEGDSWGADFIVYDIYSLRRTELTFYTPTNRDAPSSDYHFTQLVYMNDKLYGGCRENDCLVEVNIDFDNGTFTYGQDHIEPAGNSWWDRQENVIGGDLLAGYNNQGDVEIFSLTNSRLGSIIRFYDLNGMASHEQQDGFIWDLLTVNGACVLSDDKTALTSHSPIISEPYLRYWSGGGKSEYIPLSDFGLENSTGGDLASGYYGFYASDIIDLFNVDF